MSCAAKPVRCGGAVAAPLGEVRDMPVAPPDGVGERKTLLDCGVPELKTAPVVAPAGLVLRTPDGVVERRELRGVVARSPVPVLTLAVAGPRAPMVALDNVEERPGLPGGVRERNPAPLLLLGVADP